jgi:hypothetical protein
MATKMRVIPSIFEDANESEDETGVATLVPLSFDQHRQQPQSELPAAPAAPSPGVRYARGSLVYATDGPVGTLRQIVIDEDLAEVKALVVRMAAKKESVLVPPDLVDVSADAGLLLTVTQEQFLHGASRSPRLDPKMFTRARLKQVAKVMPAVFGGDPRRSVISVSGDQVATGAFLEPASGEPETAGSSWRERFRSR